ncbi:MAG: hypothetical protein LBS80_04285 [Tannerella sp.]|jgi:hypothetical protein|nr:hypothetical protein [Tannerella sp.]
MESLLDQKNVVHRKGHVWHKIRNILILLLVLGLGGGGYVRYYHPIESGIKSGRLNSVVYKGLIFKTYEGSLIEDDVKSSDNEFVFSISEKDIAETLMHASGKMVKLHYIGYYATVPWRGYSKYIINKIESISDDNEDSESMNL